MLVFLLFFIFLIVTKLEAITRKLSKPAFTLNSVTKFPEMVHFFLKSQLLGVIYLPLFLWELP